jgi:cytoskeletal protein CcmA (bactofilin family)
MADISNEMTIIGADTHIEGKMRFEKGAKINGKFDGQITGPGELTVAQNATCKADIDAGAVSVNGSIEGNVNAKDKVALNAGGRVRGDIVAAKMIMAEGAALYGQVMVGPDAQKEMRPTPAPGSSASGSSSSNAGGPPQPPKK